VKQPCTVSCHQKWECKETESGEIKCDEAIVCSSSCEEDIKDKSLKVKGRKKRSDDYDDEEVYDYVAKTSNTAAATAKAKAAAAAARATAAEAAATAPAAASPAILEWAC
jgi:hypothetical protein